MPAPTYGLKAAFGAPTVAGVGDFDDHAVGGRGKAHARDQPLQDLHGIGGDAERERCGDD